MNTPAKSSKTGTGAARSSLGDEVTCVGLFPRPKEWGAFKQPSGDKAEIALLDDFSWHPTTDDMLLVAQVPNEGRQRTQVVQVENLGRLLGAILFKDGKKERPDRTLRRLNIISHGNPGLIGLGGEIRANGDVFMTTANPVDPMVGSIDGSTIQFLNNEGKTIPFENLPGKGMREKVRDKFTADAHILLLLCNAGMGEGGKLARDLASCLNVAVDAWQNEVFYPREFTGQKITSDRTITTIGKVERTNTPSGPKFSVQELRPRGRGYPCAVSVPAPLEGKHLLPPDLPIPKPATPAP